MEFCVPPDQQAVHPLRCAILVEREASGLLEDCAEHRTRFDTRESRPDAEMGAVPESEVTFGRFARQAPAPVTSRRSLKGAAGLPGPAASMPSTSRSVGVQREFPSATTTPTLVRPGATR